MNFVSETISREDQARIIQDAGTDLAKLYRLRRGYFDNFPGTMWAVDRERHVYLRESFEAAVLAAFEVYGPDGTPLARYRYRYRYRFAA